MVIVIVASSIAVGKKAMGMLVMEGLPKKHYVCFFFLMPVIMKSCHLQMFHAGHGVPGITVVFVSLPGYRGSS